VYRVGQWAIDGYPGKFFAQAYRKFPFPVLKNGRAGQIFS
jgi:hypothetical protein